MKHPISKALEELEAAHKEGWLLTGTEEGMDRDQLLNRVMDLKAQVTALREENERLRANSLDCKEKSCAADMAIGYISELENMAKHKERSK